MRLWPPPSKGWGGCMIGSIDRPALAAELGLPEHLAIQLVVALGYPSEKVVLEDGPPEPRPYWRDAEGDSPRAQAADRGVGG